MKEIETLIPHRKPFLFVDEIEKTNKEEIIGTKKYDDTFNIFEGHFQHRKIVPGMILVESLAQCGGAGIKKFKNEENGLFVLASVEYAKFFKAVEFGQTVRMIIKNLKIGTKTIKQTGIAYVDNDPVAEATWLCIKM